MLVITYVFLYKYKIKNFLNPLKDLLFRSQIVKNAL